jgi:hypothetical protein
MILNIRFLFTFLAMAELASGQADTVSLSYTLLVSYSYCTSLTHILLLLQEATADGSSSFLRGLSDLGLVEPAPYGWIDLGACKPFAVMAGSEATCAGTPYCNVIGGQLGVSPETSITGNFITTEATTVSDSDDCAAAGLAAWKTGTAMAGSPMASEMGGLTFTPGVYTHGSSINIGLDNPTVYLDAEKDPAAKFIFQAGSTLTTCVHSNI